MQKNKENTYWPTKYTKTREKITRQFVVRRTDESLNDGGNEEQIEPRLNLMPAKPAMERDHEVE